MLCDGCCAAVNGVCTCQDFTEVNSKAEYSSIPKHSIRAVQSRVFEKICLFHPKQSIRGFGTLRSVNPKQSIREKACALDSSALETMVHGGSVHDQGCANQTGGHHLKKLRSKSSPNCVMRVRPVPTWYPHDCCTTALKP